MSRLLAFLQRLAAKKYTGTVTLRFKQGGLHLVEHIEQHRPDELPLPEIFEAEPAPKDCQS